MEAKLPDVNSGIVTHRKAVMNAYDKGDYVKCVISFDGIIALLPEEYKPTINTVQYLKAIKGKRLMICDNCTTIKEIELENGKKQNVDKPSEFLRENIEPFELVLSPEDSCILGVQKSLVWTCPKCESTRPLIGSNVRNEEFLQPFYTGIIPDMPRRHGLHDRIGYSRRFKEWYQVAFREIENKIGAYRAEYAKQNPDEELVNLDDA